MAEPLFSLANLRLGKLGVVLVWAWMLVDSKRAAVTFKLVTVSWGAVRRGNMDGIFIVIIDESKNVSARCSGWPGRSGIYGNASVT
jgi:hypothetical protein